MYERFGTSTNERVKILRHTIFVFALLSPLVVHAEYPPRRAAPEVVRIPAGMYSPILRGRNDPARVPVKAFLLAAHAVTNSEFLAFVRENPKWRRSAIAPIFADPGYLAHWQSDLEPGRQAPPRAPVVNISWFAARAYAKWRNLRLPTTAEWEVAARAGFDRADGGKDPAMRRKIAEWFAAPSPKTLPDADAGRTDFNGVRNLQGLVWEWVADFNSAMVTGESRADAGLERNLFCGAGAIGARDSADYPAFMRLAFRSSLRANFCVANLGFRCAQTIPNKSK